MLITRELLELAVKNGLVVHEDSEISLFEKVSQRTDEVIVEQIKELNGKKHEE